MTVLAVDLLDSLYSLGVRLSVREGHLKLDRREALDALVKHGSKHPDEDLKALAKQVLEHEEIIAEIITTHYPDAMTPIAVAGPVTVSSRGQQPRKGPCSVCRFMNETVGGDWICFQCATQEPGLEPTREWDTETATLVGWFVDEGHSLIPSEPFELSPARHVTDPPRFRDALLSDIAQGPDGPRSRFGALRHELVLLRRLFATSVTRPESEWNNDD